MGCLAASGDWSNRNQLINKMKRSDKVNKVGNSTHTARSVGSASKAQLSLLNRFKVTNQ